MNKEFVKYNQALALKELGFEEPCFGFYTEEYKTLIKNFCKYPINLPTKPFLTPTFSQTFRWFRENYKLHSYIEGAYPWFRFYINSDDNRWEGFKHLTYEEAESTCLDKLIEIVRHTQS